MSNMKPGKLSKTEYTLIQEHAEAGYNILKGIDFPRPVAEMIRHRDVLCTMIRQNHVSTSHALRIQ